MLKVQEQPLGQQVARNGAFWPCPVQFGPAQAGPQPDNRAWAPTTNKPPADLSPQRARLKRHRSSYLAFLRLAASGRISSHLALSRSIAPAHLSPSRWTHLVPSRPRSSHSASPEQPEQPHAILNDCLALSCQSRKGKSPQAALLQ